MDDSAWAGRFPALWGLDFQPYANADLRFRLGVPDDALVTRLHLVAQVADGRVVVCRSAEGWRFLPGGRREAGESLTELAARELREEAGCALVGEIEVFAYQDVRSRNAEPHQEHFPHPRSAWAFATAQVEHVGPPTNPSDGEVVVEVRIEAVAEAAAWLRLHEAEPADVLLLADSLGLLSR
ncbi:NUDIX domain-containing protein [Nocardioides cynanchi]|uniref:NUDIX domain-containing protein n=1 Tax=Nocardioides cynanchi TaxID=2558918 RepID=UPI0012458C91|nr:NUDIX hydrolase [Nocardioides cynanchi]